MDSELTREEEIRIHALSSAMSFSACFLTIVKAREIIALACRLADYISDPDSDVRAVEAAMVSHLSHSERLRAQALSAATRFLGSKILLVGEIPPDEEVLRKVANAFLEFFRTGREFCDPNSS